jgi:hypothetical protein
MSDADKLAAVTEAIAKAICSDTPDLAWAKMGPNLRREFLNDAKAILALPGLAVLSDNQKLRDWTGPGEIEAQGFRRIIEVKHE